MITLVSCKKACVHIYLLHNVSPLLLISDTTVFFTKCHIVVAGIIPSQDPADACHYTMPNYIELNRLLKNLVNKEQFRLGLAISKDER